MTKTNSEENVEATIMFEGDEVKVNLSLHDFKFHDIDAWVRSRFGVKSDDQLRYMDKLGGECIPDKESLFSKKTVYIKKIKSPVTKPTFLQRWLFPLCFLSLTLSWAAIAFYSQNYFSQIVPFKKWCSQLDMILVESGLSPKKGVALEAFIAMVCWSLTYLFIRRLVNPETSKATFEKYSADSFFGGLAAAGSVFLKAFLTSAWADK